MSRFDLLCRSNTISTLLSILAAPVSCLSSAQFICSCYYYLYYKANVYSCFTTSGPVEMLPTAVPHGTDWLVIENSQVNQLAGSYSYLMSIWYLNLQGSKIESMGDDFVNTLDRNKTLRWLNLANNRLSNIPRRMQELTFLQHVSLSGNLFDCHCSMIWMVGWLNNFTTTGGDHVIVDYKDVFCYSGLNIGDPI